MIVHKHINFAYKKILYWSSFSPYKKDILRSQFHLKGHKHFLKSKFLNQQQNSLLGLIQIIQRNLSKNRVQLLETTNEIQWKDSKQVVQSEKYHEYLSNYEKLLEAFEQSKFNEEWYYQLAGWYNMQMFLEKLVFKMMDSKNKVNHNSLVETIWWMSPNKLTQLPQEDFRESQLNKKALQNYYKKLSVSLELQMLRKIQAIIETFSISTKKKYYDTYMKTNLTKILEQFSRSKLVKSDLIWIYERYVTNYNDNNEVIQKIQSRLQKIKQYTEDDIRMLMNIYNFKGQIPQKIFQIIYQNRLNRQNLSTIEIVNNIQFMVHSEKMNLNLLTIYLAKIYQLDQIQQMSDELKLKLHYLLHYCQVKQQSIVINSSLQTDLISCCRRHQGNGSLALKMTAALDMKGKQQNKKYFTSECVKRISHRITPKQNVAQPVKLMPQYKKYDNVRFCCIQIQKCLKAQGYKDTIVLQRFHKQFSYSKRLRRSQQVRNELLSHYGFKVSYLSSQLIPGPNQNKESQVQTQS